MTVLSSTEIIPSENKLANRTDFIQGNLNNLRASWLGLMEYSEALNHQFLSVDSILTGESQLIVLGVHHPSVITLGKRARINEEITWSSEELKHHAIQVVRSDRGGLATLHSPGQLVIYPILKLENFGLTIKSYVELLLHCSQVFLESLGVICYQMEGQPGLFTQFGKIVFIGIRVENGISRHGIAINIANDLSMFNSIYACGTRSAKLTRLINFVGFGDYHGDLQEELLRELFQKWMSIFLNHLCLTSVKVQV